MGLLILGPASASALDLGFNPAQPIIDIRDGRFKSAEPTGLGSMEQGPGALSNFPWFTFDFGRVERVVEGVPAPPALLIRVCCHRD